MNADEFNALVELIVTTLEDRFNPVEVVFRADTEGTLPELYVNVNGTDLSLTISPI